MIRSEIVSDYFQLLKYLNRANQNSDLVTDVRFEIGKDQTDCYVLFAVCYGPSQLAKLALARQAISGKWHTAGFSNFHKIEEFCSTYLNKNAPLATQPKNSIALSDSLRLRLTNNLTTQLKMLLLNNSYEP
jgi:hypothetical protein